MHASRRKLIPFRVSGNFLRAHPFFLRIRIRGNSSSRARVITVEIHGGWPRGPKPAPGPGGRRKG
jgi:hypothetical protein